MNIALIRNFILLLLPLSLALVACESQNSIRQEKLKQDAFLKKAYSKPKKVSAEKPALKTDFYDEIMAGKTAIGMNLMETKMATRTHPHGPNRNNMVYWCNRKPVPRCDHQCGYCAATLFAEHHTHYLEGRGQNLYLVKSIGKRTEDTVVNFRSKPYKVISALFRNEIVTGMELRDYQRIELAPQTKQKFFCKNQRVFKNCLLNCTDCTIELITPRENKFHIKRVRFRGKTDFKTIVDVKESTRTSIQ